MTALTDFCNTIRAWLNYGDTEYTDALVTTFVRGAETTLSTTLRVKHMLQIDTGVVVVDRVLLPSDWVGLDLARVVGGSPLTFRTREQFYTANPNDENYNNGFYTISGNYLIVKSGWLDGQTIELHYFQDIPPLTDPATFLLTKYPLLFQFAAMAVAENYARDFDAASVWEGKTTALVTQLNDEYTLSKTPKGQVLRATPRRKGFG